MQTPPTDPRTMPAIRMKAQDIKYTEKGEKEDTVFVNMFDRKKGRTSRKILKRTNFITVEHIYEYGKLKVQTPPPGHRTPADGVASTDKRKSIPCGIPSKKKLT